LIEKLAMYIREEGDEFILVRNVRGADGNPTEAVLAGLGQDPELNLFIAAEQGRRSAPELWEGVQDFHLLQALENFKRRTGSFRPALVLVDGKQPDPKPDDPE
jgi:hypothetical protein